MCIKQRAKIGKKLQIHKSAYRNQAATNALSWAKNVCQLSRELTARDELSPLASPVVIWQSWLLTVSLS